MSILWKPKNEVKQIVHPCNLTKFRYYAESTYNVTLANYRALYIWSITNISDFWKSSLLFCKVIYGGSPNLVIDENAKIDDLPSWFPYLRVNYAENILSKGRPTDVAIISVDESFSVRKITYKTLKEYVFKYANAMQKFGYKSGDCIVAILPNRLETIYIYLASAAIGAVFCCISPDSGIDLLKKKLLHLSPNLIFTTEQFTYNGVKFQTKLSSAIPTVYVDNFKSASAFLKHGSRYDFQFKRFPFSHPLAILFTSGTTGDPKGIIHSHGGVLVQHAKEHIIHGDLKRDDIFFYCTSAAWMMWNWSVSALFSGCTVVIYDGHPLYKKKPSILMDICEKFNVTVFGTSAKYISTLRSKSIRPKRTHNLSKIRVIYSTGSPLEPNDFFYVYQHISNKAMLSSITGGTDIISLFAGPCPLLPVRAGEIQAPMLGMAIYAFDENGEAVYGKAGDLVCTKPFPSMPVGFINDPDNVRYKESYFSTFKGVWSHGDYVSISKDTLGVKMLGRSDGVLNPGGIRIGTSEIYNVVNGMMGIVDSVAVGLKKDGDEEIVLFCKMRNGIKFTADMERKLKEQIKDRLSVRHVPSKIYQVSDIPYTNNGKKMEKLVKAIVNGNTDVEKVADTTIANPLCLRDYVRPSQLQSKL